MPLSLVFFSLFLLSYCSCINIWNMQLNGRQTCKVNWIQTGLMLSCTNIVVSFLYAGIVSLSFTDVLMWHVNTQDKDGDTALHCSIHGRRYQSMCALLEAGADPSLVNFNILTPLHLAVKVGFLP